MPKNKDSRFHTTFGKLNKKDKAFITSQYYSLLHLQSLQGMSIKQIWIKASENILKDFDTLPSGKIICPHHRDKFKTWGEYEDNGLSCTLPTYNWAKDRRIQNSLINVQDYLYGWKDRPFSMEFIAPVNTPASTELDSRLKLDCIKDIKGSLTLVRQVWKTLLVNGRNMTIRQAHWLSIVGGGYQDVLANPDGVEEVVASALQYAKEESAYELLNKQKTDKTPFKTTELDYEHMIFGRALSVGLPDDNAVEVEHDIASSMGQVPARFQRTFTAPYSEQFGYELRKEILDYTPNDTALVIGLTMLQESNDRRKGKDISTNIKNVLQGEASNLFVLGVRAIINKARYNEYAVVLWERDHKVVTEKLVALLALLLEEPSNTRDVGVLDLLEIEHRTYPVTEILEMEAEINQYGAMTLDQIYQQDEARTIVEAIKEQDD